MRTPSSAKKLRRMKGETERTAGFENRNILAPFAVCLCAFALKTYLTSLNTGIA